MGRPSAQDGEQSCALTYNEAEGRSGLAKRYRQQQIEQESAAPLARSHHLEVDRIIRQSEHQRLLLHDRVGEAAPTRQPGADVVQAGDIGHRELDFVTKPDRSQQVYAEDEGLA